MSRNARLINRSENDVYSGYQEAAKRNALSKPNASRLMTFLAPGKQRPDSPRKATKLGSMKESTNVQVSDYSKSRLRDGATEFKMPLGLANRNQNDGGKGCVILANPKAAEVSKQITKSEKPVEVKLTERAGTKLTTRLTTKQGTKLTQRSNDATKPSENVAQKLLSADSLKLGGILTQKPIIETRSRAAAKRTVRHDDLIEKMDVCNSRDTDEFNEADMYVTAQENLGVVNEAISEADETDEPLQPERTDLVQGFRDLRAEREVELTKLAGALHIRSPSKLLHGRRDAIEEPEESDDDHHAEESTSDIETDNETADAAVPQSDQVLHEEPTLVNDPKLRRTLMHFEAHDPQLLADYVDEHFAYMRILEVTKMAVRRGYMMPHWEVKPRYRELAFDWLVCVAQRFNLLPETYYLATHLFDRFMQQLPVPRTQIQLVAIASLYVASKLEETYLPDVSDFLFVTDDAISRAELFEAERKLLDTLQFAVNAPNPLTFLRRYSRIFQYALMLARREDSRPNPQLGSGYTQGWIDAVQRIDVRRVHQLSKYVLETSTFDYELAHVGASLRAAASLLLAMRAVAWPRHQLAARQFDAAIGLVDDLICEVDSHGEFVRVDSSNVTVRGGRQRTQIVRLPSMWTTSLVCHSEHSESDLLPIVRRLAMTLVRTRRDAKLQSTRAKYSDAQFDSIARGPELETVLQLGEQLLSAKNA